MTQTTNLSREMASEHLLEFLDSEVSDSDTPVKLSDNLGDVLRSSQLGVRGAGLQVAHYMEKNYGVPINEAVKVNPDEMRVYDLIDAGIERKS